MFNKNLKLMTSKDAEEWLFHFISNKINNNKNDGVLIIPVKEIKRGLTSVGYNKNLIDDNSINEVLKKNNFIYKKVEDSYVIINYITNQFSEEMLYKMIDNLGSKNCAVINKVRKSAILLMICTVVVLISTILK